LIAQGPHLLLLDEPTNHLDMPTCEALEEALADYPGAVVLVSHDRRLVEQIATEVLLLEGGRAEPVNRVDEAFARIGLGPLRPATSAEERTAAPRRSAVEEERRRLRRNAARARERVTTLAVELEGAETRLREIDELLCDRAVYSDHLQATALAREADELRAARDESMEAWVEAEDDAAALEARLEELAQEG
jgi:ATP-binding cassette subfamily F protein 3